MASQKGPIAPEDLSGSDDFNDSVQAVNKYSVQVYDNEGSEKENASDNEGSENKNASDIEEGSTSPNNNAWQQSSRFLVAEHPPSFFTNDRGNLKVVGLVVRNPCKIFWLLMTICIIIMVLLVNVVFLPEGASPFTLPAAEFDLKDVRSVQYDSLRLAQEQVGKDLETLKVATEGEGEEVKKQSESAGVTYWVFEADTENTQLGLFGSATAIGGMKDAYDIFYNDPGFQRYCLLEYPDDRVVQLASSTGNKTTTDGGTEGANQTNPLDIALETADETTEATEPFCTAPLSPLNMYYASEWNETKVEGVIEQLSDPDNVEKFNTLSLCALKQLYCELLPKEINTAENRLWAVQLGAEIISITDKWDMEGPLVEDFDQATKLAAYLMQVDIFKGVVDFGYDTEFSASNPISQFSRGIVFWGLPFEDTTQKAGDDADEMFEKEDDELKEYVIANYLEEMDKQSEKGTHADINSYYFMTMIIGDVILNILQADAMLAIFSFAFVFFWLSLNTKSWFLALVGFFEIFFSVPIAWFLFSVVFRIKYFGTLNTLAIFVVAAIGADDIFIFMDAYKQSQYHPEILVDLETRLSWVYRRTGHAMAITSATTCAAFLCALVSPLASLQSFGIFAAVVIFIDYVLVMTLFCTAVVIYHDRYENSARFGCCCPCGTVTPSNTDEARLALENRDEEMKRDRVSEFFKTKVAGFVQVPLHRLVLCVIFLIWIAIAIWQATLIEAAQGAEQFLDEDHPLQKSVTLINNHFPTADDDIGLKVYYVTGVDEVDRSGVNLLLDPENYGSPKFDREFDFSTKCQSDLLDFCDKLRTDPQYKNLIKQKDGVGSVTCFIEELAVYNLVGNLDDCTYVRKGTWKDEDWQVNSTERLSKLMPDFLQSKTCISGEGRKTVSEMYRNEIGWNGIGLRFAGVSVESNKLDPFGTVDESTTRAEYDQFIAIGEEQEKILSKSCRGDIIMTDLDGAFTFMNNQRIYVRSAIQSSILGVAIAFFVLLISTRVFHLAFFASLSIMSVLISVVGTMVMMGWYLGSIESILIGITAGFSVDYVVHLAHAYEIAKGDTNARVTEAFADLGISVFNGMITSVAASIPLFFCKLVFFAKFGTFLCLTIVFSWIFANFGFMSLLTQLKIPLKEKGCRL